MSSRNRSRFLSFTVVGLLALTVSCGTQEPPSGNPVPQTITFAALDDRPADAAPFDVSASASSGLPVAFTASGACAIDERTVTLDGVVGSCTVTASQPGNDDYLPAEDVARSFAVTEPAGPTLVGFVLLTETGAEGARTIGGTGTFVERDTPLDGAFPGDPFDGSTATCLVSDGSGGGDPTPAPDTAGTPVDAGAPLTVRQAGTPYVTLTSDAVGEYALDASSPPSPPLPATDLVLDVPGAAFPTFEGAAFVDTPAFELAAGFDPGSIDIDTTFAWIGSAGTDAVALLIGGDGAVTFSCVVPDDGAFSFDAETRDELAAAGFASGSLQAAGRLSVASSGADDALLLLGALRLSSYDGPADGGSLVTLAHHTLRTASVRR